MEKTLRRFANEWHRIMEICSFTEEIERRHEALLKGILKKLKPHLTLQEFHRKIDLTFTCVSCKRKVTEKVAYSRRKQKKYCSKCSGSAYWRKLHPEYMPRYNRKQSFKHYPAEFLKFGGGKERAEKTSLSELIFAGV